MSDYYLKKKVGIATKHSLDDIRIGTIYRYKKYYYLRIWPFFKLYLLKSSKKPEFERIHY